MRCVKKQGSMIHIRKKQAIETAFEQAQTVDLVDQNSYYKDVQRTKENHA